MHKLILLSIERCFRWREKERETQESWKRGEACEDVCVCAWRATACICIVHAAG